MVKYVFDLLTLSEFWN